VEWILSDSILYAEDNKTKFSCTVRIGKSEADVTNKCVSNTTNAGVQLKYVQHSAPFSMHGNISVADCNRILLFIY